MLLIVLVFLSLLLGWATATECAAWGVLGSLAIAWWHGTLTWRSFWESVMGATRVTCMIMLILAGASYMSTSMAYTGIPQALAAWVDSLNLSPYALIAALTVMYIVLGTALDGISMIVLTTAVVHADGQEGRLRPGVVRHLHRAGGRDGRGLAAGRLQPVRAADHERQGFQYRRAGVAAVLLPAGRGGRHHHGVSRDRDGAAAHGIRPKTSQPTETMMKFRKLLTKRRPRGGGRVLALAGTGDAQAQTKWNLPTAYPTNNPHIENLAAFAKDVEQATGGKLQIARHPAASLFKGPEIKRAVETGQAQMGEILISIHENEEAIFGLDVIPFLATSYGDSKKLWLASSPAVLEKKLGAQGMMVLMAMPWARRASTPRRTSTPSTT